MNIRARVSISILVLFVAIARLLSADGQQPVAGSMVRVGILTGVSTAHISCAGWYYLYELSTGERSNIKPEKSYRVSGCDGKITVGDITYTAPIRLVPIQGEDQLNVNGKRYRDALYITGTGCRFSIINELDIDDYLKGVLPREVDPGWPIESLKAQAVASRTYTLKNLKRHDQEGFDVCATVHCQVFGGAGIENAVMNDAIHATAGQVIMFKGTLALAVFHASCGGHTENPTAVWDWKDSEAPEYLCGVRDRCCGNSPHNYWENSLPIAVVEKKLNAAGFRVRAIRSLQPRDETPSGRARTIRVRTASGHTDIPSGKFRLAVDPWLIKSTKFQYINRVGDRFEFSGFGWGHGVGMCQWGAKEMAEQGRDYKDILRHFFPGTTIEQWEQ